MKFENGFEILDSRSLNETATFFAVTNCQGSIVLEDSDNYDGHVLCVLPGRVLTGLDIFLAIPFVEIQGYS